ncbi:hypothetical protein SOVF_151690 [Spinacia oleracea]|uniref:Phytosulfokine n=1 Tax=Spinacia oleracea TaxID=3562 RepID=A0ABM3RUB1_SPIOL|nr:putative phytosulfokines 6 [Spinacia oleracea]KNA09643.1 hypothetical protein SOVF_151690 [Spinacia oleracea]
MMHKFLTSTLLIVILLCLVAFPTTSARLLVHKPADDQNHQISNAVPIPKSQDKDSIDELMGLEICGNGDEECLKRRLVSEVHLDYIYTQHQNP